MADKSIVPFIESQFPQFVLDSGSLLVPFMQAYYEWMHNKDNLYDRLSDISQLNDIDASLVKFSEEFSQEYLANFPQDLITDKSLTIKHIVDLYKSKGTPAATQLLLKMILGKDSEIFYPSTQILKPSDGNWIQDNSVLVQVMQGDVFSIVGQSVQISTATLTFSSIVERVRSTSTSGIYEVFLERKLIYDITNNSILSYLNTVLKTKKTVTHYKILNGGSGFSIGQIFEVKSVNGKGTFAKVKSITSTGSIKSIQFIKFGYGYESDFIGGVSLLQKSSNVLVQFTNLSDKVQNISDSGYINTVDYFELAYADGSYVGDVLSTFRTDNIISSDPNQASIEFLLGTKIKYPGYYNSVNGFLSDSIYLQDSLYYQAYSYVVKIDEVLEKYQSKVESTIHPAGMILFGEYAIKNKFQLNTHLKFILNFFRESLSDSIASSDLFSKFLTKGFNDYTYPSDATTRAFTKNLIDSIVSLDSATKLFNKSLLDSITSNESKLFNINKLLQDSSLSLDIKAFSLSTSKIDSISVSDLITLGFLLNKYYNDTQIIKDNGGSLYLNYYTQPGYWQNDYSAGATTF